MNEELQTIDRVFTELKTKGLVAPSRRLHRREDYWHLDFGSDRFSHRIYYNERHSCLEDDPLRLALLHEEWHLTSRETRNVWYEVDLTATAMLLGLAYSSLVYLGGFATFCLVIPMFIASLRASQWLFRRVLGRQETKADLHAAGTLFNKFGLERPSLVAASLFQTLRERPRDRTSIMYRVRKLMSVEFHPSDEERIKAIQGLEESLAK